MALDQLEQFMAAMRRLESGSYEGDYQAEGTLITSGMYEGQRAYGAYQIMPGNWDAWAREAGISGAKIYSKAAQDAVARYKLTEYYLKYRDWDLVAIAWFAGGATADKAARSGIGMVMGLQDANDTTVRKYIQDISRYMDAYEPPPDSIVAGVVGAGFGAYGGEEIAAAQQPTPVTYQVSDPNEELEGFISATTAPGQSAPQPTSMQQSMVNVLRAISTGVRAGVGLGAAGPTDKIELRSDRNLTPDHVTPIEIPVHEGGGAIKKGNAGWPVRYREA